MRSRWIGLALAVVGAAASRCTCDDVETPPPGPTHVQIEAGELRAVVLSTAAVDARGGTITVAEAASPLAGLSIVVPPGAVRESIAFEVRWADVTGAAGLPEGAFTASKLITIETTGSEGWNEERMFDAPVLVTLPYAPQATADDDKTVRFFTLASDATLEPEGVAGLDYARRSVTFHTRTFADSAEGSRMPAAGGAGLSASSKLATYVGIGVGARWKAWLEGGTAIDTGFLPSVNGWFIPNYGSYYKASRGGSCFGFVAAAKHHFRRGFTPALYSAYRDPDGTATWLDDAVAIELTSRVHNGLADIWSTFTSTEVDTQVASSEAVALSYAGAMYVTGLPALLYIQQKTVDAHGVAAYSGAHAIMVHAADFTGDGKISFHVYDPNFPGKDDRRIAYTFGSGFSNYASGTDASSSRFQYNYFHHVGYHVGLSDAVVDGLKLAADRGFSGDTVFPKITITEVRGVEGSVEKALATEDKTAAGEHTWVTPFTAVKISGTILGGLAQDPCCVVDNARVFVDNKRFSARVNNSAGGGDGKFSVVVPVAQGDNELVIIAAKRNSFSNWAAFARDAVRSTASASALTVTMRWGQPTSDVDLYVKEPDSADGAKRGDTVYFGHRKGASDTSPYLDFDNTAGYGPEHYYARIGTRTLYTDASAAEDAYGDYKIGVHYYADHRCNALSGEERDRCLAEPPQTITWSLDWRYLAFCAAPCASPEDDGFWVEGGTSGTLATPSASNCCDIEHSGPDWSSPAVLRYPRPDPEDFIVPPSTRVMLP